MRHPGRLVLLAILLTPTALRAWPDGPETTCRVLLLPGGVADLAGRTGFVANANHGTAPTSRLIHGSSGT